MIDSDRIVVVAPNWLGDAVMALPALADLRRHFAGARLAVAARTSVAALFALVDGVDEVVLLPGGGGLRAMTGWRADATALSRGGFHTAVLLPNSFVAAFGVFRAGIAERWGYATDCRRRLLTRAVPKAGGRQHQAAYYQALVAALGVESGPPFARVRVDAAKDNPKADAPLASARQILLEAGIAENAPFAVFAPGAAYGRAKQWPPVRFGELARLVATEARRPVVLVGTGADRAVCAEIAMEAGSRRSGGHDGRASDGRGHVVDLSGRTDLATLVGVLSLSRAVVANDSGAMHLAGAVGARVVAVFGATDEARTAPLTSGPTAVAPRILSHRVFCRPCMLRECPIDHRCMRGVTARQVFDALGDW